MDACLSLSTHTHVVRVHVNIQNHNFMPSFIFFHFFFFFLVQNDSYALVVIFYKIYNLTRVGVVPIIYLHGIRP